MQFEPSLVPGTLIKRYKRFLADVQLADGSVVVAHCANPGSMLGLNEPGLRVWLQPSVGAARKLDWSWKLVELPSGAFVCIDTSVPNRVIHEALCSRAIDMLSDYSVVRREVKFGVNSRVDFLLSDDKLPDLYLEIKSVHLNRKDSIAEFPDSVTVRGAKHLFELSNACMAGNRAMMLYFIQREDCNYLTIADDIDPSYAIAFANAIKAGVDVVAYGTEVSSIGIKLGAKIDIV